MKYGQYENIFLLYVLHSYGGSLAHHVCELHSDVN